MGHAYTLAPLTESQIARLLWTRVATFWAYKHTQICFHLSNNPSKIMYISSVHQGRQVYHAKRKDIAKLRDLIAAIDLVRSTWLPCLACVTLKLDGDLLGIVIFELKFDSSLLSANSGIGPKLPICLPLWPPNWTNGQKTTVHLFYASRSFVQHFIAICKLKLELPSEIGDFLVPCNLETWRIN